MERGREMLILPQTLLIVWNGATKKHFIEKGYIFTKLGDYFEVNILDMLLNHNYKIIVSCDYCGRVFPKENNNYQRDLKNKFCTKTSCVKCAPIKQKEITLLKYGVTNINHLSWVKDKKIETFINNYGVDNPQKDQNVRNKTVKTNNEKYGCDMPPNNKEINAKMLKSHYINDTGKSSKQQRLINKIVDGELNFPVGNCALDIAFPDEKIYIEYDGSGHKLSIKFKSSTEKEYLHKEKKRYYFLKKLGWKEIRIKSLNDYLPNEEKIIEIINKAKDFLLNEDHSWFEINIDEKKIKSSTFDIFYDFGNLKKIRRPKKGA